MRKRFINGTDFTSMVLHGAAILHDHVDHVNALNVFPVPDGDTGTNMNMTITAGAGELKAKSSPQLGKSAEILSKGLLMGARGNSGVIMSQLFRGFAKSVAGIDEANAVQFAAALQHGVDTAYKAVVKPIEGTILTVAKEAAKYAVTHARRDGDITELMEGVCIKAKEALARTPDLLPVLKQVGVVDSGGQGLVYVYEGFVKALQEQDHSVERKTPRAASNAPAETPALAFIPKSAQAQLSTENIDFPYDMEFFINPAVPGVKPFNEIAFRDELAKDGDSILIIADDVIKVHVHSKAPGRVFNLALEYGELTQIHILNMREQHRDLLAEEAESTREQLVDSKNETQVSSVEAETKFKSAYGMIAVSMGDGISNIFKSLGVQVVLTGGQTMNPSTEDFVNAIESIQAQHIFIFPNNSNIIMAAEQAKELSERGVTVVRSKTIPQGLSAALAFQPHESVEKNEEAMQRAISRVKSGQVTYAVRDTSIEGIAIKEGDYIGIMDGKIVVSTPSLQQTSEMLLDRLVSDEDEMITVISGEDVQEEQLEQLSRYAENKFSHADLDVHEGGQPLYYYLFAVE